jgi:hypothetical protein
MNEEKHARKHFAAPLRAGQKKRTVAVFECGDIALYKAYG